MPIVKIENSLIQQTLNQDLVKVFITARLMGRGDVITAVKYPQLHFFPSSIKLVTPLIDKFKSHISLLILSIIMLNYVRLYTLRHMEDNNYSLFPRVGPRIGRHHLRWSPKSSSLTQEKLEILKSNLPKFTLAIDEGWDLNPGILDP